MLASDDDTAITDGDGDTDQVQVVARGMVLFQCRWSDTNGSVLVRVCLLRCEEEVCFKILKWFNIKNKIRLLDFLSPPNDTNS